MKNPGVLMGKLPEEIDGTRKIDLLITEECNLRCKYCYLVGKNSNRKMSLEVARRAVDFILTNRMFSEPGVVWALSGAEALLEIELIDQITDYIKFRMIELNHPWLNKYIFFIGTNGLLYNHPKVQEYIAKNYNHLNIAITIDGCKEKHDNARVFPDGSGSYDQVVNNVKLWMKQFPKNVKHTKATFSHEDLPYLKDSVIKLWELGIQYVMANVVFEDVWQEGDDILFENQLKELADYILENELWRDYSVRFFNPNIGFPMLPSELENAFCGSGKHMTAIDCDGKIYPCIRFTGFSLENKKPLSIGDIYRGIDEDKLRAFLSFNIKSISSKECINCEVASGCPHCAGTNYDFAKTNTVFHRATYLCNMYKANIRACDYFWNKFKAVTGLDSPREQAIRKWQKAKKISKEPKFMLFLLNDGIVPHCRYNSKKENIQAMSLEVFKRGMEFAAENNFIPVFIGDDTPRYTSTVNEITITSPCASFITENANSIIIFDEKVENVISNAQICTILISKNTIDNLYDYIAQTSRKYKRVNIVIKDILDWGKDECDRYQEQLKKLVELVVSDAKEKRYYDLNVLTDLIKLKKMNNCDAGQGSVTLAPNGMFYQCPAFYFDDPSKAIGTLDGAIEIEDEYLLSLEHAPICSICDAYQCNRCTYINFKATGEINTPSKIQCMVSHIERNATRLLQLKLQAENMAVFIDVLPEIDYSDPLEIILRQQGMAGIIDKSVEC
ncbi:MAG: radical SAM peptide maturase, CXXX-repeat target family [Firmicutes bacterium]|nr:radical SAM peptide maturase, CXXX-repeat target family [Bacillota bacterium]